MCVYLGRGRRVRFVEQCPYSRLDALPTRQSPGLELSLQSELLHDVLLGWFVGVEVEPIQCLQCLLRVTMRCVGHPAAWLHLANK